MIRNYTQNISTRDYVRAFNQETLRMRRYKLTANADKKTAFAGVYNIIFANDFLSGEITDFMSDIQKTKAYRQEVKQVCKKIVADIKAYEKQMLNTMTTSAEYFGDSADRMYEIISKDRDILYWAIKQHLDDQQIKDSAFLSRVVLLDVIANYCVTTVDFYVEKISELMGFKCDHLEDLRLTSIHKSTTRLVEILGKNKQVDFINNERCKQAYEIFSNKMGDLNNIKYAVLKEDEIDE